MLDAANIKKVITRQEKDGIRAEIKGEVDWCRYRVILLLPESTPGLINSQVEIVAKRQIGLDKQLFAEQNNELDYMSGKSSDKLEILNRLVYYFNGTPGANTYHVVKPNSGAIYDLNQFIYYGDPTVLNATLLFYEDFTSLNPFFKNTGTKILNSVRQPPGCLRTPMVRDTNQPSNFGFDVPTVKKPIQKGRRMLLANSFFMLTPGAPQIQETVRYCGRFIDDYAAIYPLIEKPEPKFIDWPSITEQGFKDLTACAEMKLGPGVQTEKILDLQSGAETIIAACHRYTEHFDSQRGKELVAGGDAMWPRTRGYIKLPYGDAWAMLFVMIMAGEYGHEFGSESAMSIFMDASDNLIKAGQALQYRYPMRINADLTKAAGSRYEYDCVGAYVYLMLLYHRITGEEKYLDEARASADVLLTMGFEYPFEFTTTAFGPLGMLRLYNLTGDKRYLEGCAIPMAAILRHSWLFNPDYGDYRGRTIFLLTEGMPGVYSNGWEEATLIHYLQLFMLEGRDVLPPEIMETTSELLRWKGVSGADGLIPLLPDPSIVATGKPLQWSLPINKDWHIPVEGYGYLEWDVSGYYEKPGTVSQGPYCFGLLPELAIMLFHPLNEKVTLYVEAPITLEKHGEEKITFATFAGQETFRAALQGQAEGLAGASVRVKETGSGSASSKVDLKTAEDGRLWFTVSPRKQYTIKLSEIVNK